MGCFNSLIWNTTWIYFSQMTGGCLKNSWHIIMAPVHVCSTALWSDLTAAAPLRIRTSWNPVATKVVRQIPADGSSRAWMAVVSDMYPTWKQMSAWKKERSSKIGRVVLLFWPAPRSQVSLQSTTVDMLMTHAATHVRPFITSVYNKRFH